MAVEENKSGRASTRALLLSILMVTGTLFASSAIADDTDEDGTDDSMDDCPVAAGNSTLDRTGCPDRDGDGTSDLNDPWVMSTGGYQQDAYHSSSDDYIMVRFNHDASQYVTAENSGGWGGGGSTSVRIWDTSTRTNLRTIQHGESAADVDWSPDGQFVALLTNDNEVRIYYANNASLYETMDAGGEESRELEYSPDGTMIAVACNRDGNSGPGQVEIFDAITGSLLESLEPGGDDEFYSVDWSPDGNRLVMGGDEKIYIWELDGSGTWSENRTISNAFSTLNSVHYSPDGNMFSACSAWGGSNARAKVYNAITGAEM